MVVSTRNSRDAVYWSPDRRWWRFGGSTVYLHAVLVNADTMKKRLPELDVYKANLAISTGLLVLYVFAYPNRNLLYVGTVVGVITLLWPALAQWISWGWYKLAEGLGYVNSAFC